MLVYVIIKGLRKEDFQSVFYASVGLFTVVVISSLQMSDKLYVNPHYAPASDVQLIANEMNVNVYRLTDLPPEIIWDYGETIPLLTQFKDSLCFPNEKQFALIIDAGALVEFQNQFSNYKIKKFYTINMFFRQTKKKRLIKDFYLVERDAP